MAVVLNCKSGSTTFLKQNPDAACEDSSGSTGTISSGGGGGGGAKGAHQALK